MSQLDKLRPMAPAPRRDLGLKPLADPMAKVREIDNAFADIKHRLDHLEQGAGIESILPPAQNERART